jgi:hypothetical protein
MDQLDMFLAEHRDYKFSWRHKVAWCRHVSNGHLPSDFNAPEHKTLYCGPKDKVQTAWRNIPNSGEPPVPNDEFAPSMIFHPNAAYESDIVYGDVMSFQGDMLRHELKAHGTRDVGGQMRPLDIAICDECDSLQVIPDFST